MVLEQGKKWITTRYYKARIDKLEQCERGRDRLNMHEQSLAMRIVRGRATSNHLRWIR